MFDKQHTFEISPKPKKVNEQIEEIRRKRTFEIEMSAVSQSSPDLRPTPSMEVDIRRPSESANRKSSNPFDRFQSSSMSTLSPTAASIFKSQRGGPTLHGQVYSGSNHSVSMEAEAPESLQSILADDRLLDLFAKHLVKEFCVECLLALSDSSIYILHSDCYLDPLHNLTHHLLRCAASSKCSSLNNICCLL